MTKRECAVIMTYTGTCMLTGDDLKYFYEYIAELIGRPVYTHEIPALADDLEEKAKPDFIRLCRAAAEPKAKTNADRIRRMTDEELAEFLDTATTCCADGDSCDKCPLGTIKPQCNVITFEKWLKQEVSEDERH